MHIIVTRMETPVLDMRPMGVHGPLEKERVFLGKPEASPFYDRFS